MEKHEFPATHTLHQVHEFITNNFTHDDSFSLLTTFPKKEFSGKDLESTLQQAGRKFAFCFSLLDLVPRGVVVVQPVANKGVVKKYEAPLDDSRIDTDAMSYEV